MTNSKSVMALLQQLIEEPSLARARDLETALRKDGLASRLFGRLNQKSSIDAAAESDRGIVERIANAFDASLTAARKLGNGLSLGLGGTFISLGAVDGVDIM